MGPDERDSNMIGHGKIDIRVARTDEEHAACANLRHEIGHETGCCNRELCSNSIVLYARVDDSIAGTASVSFGARPVQDYRALLDVDQLEHCFADDIAFVSRIAVPKEHPASGTVFLELSRASYRIALDLGAAVCLNESAIPEKTVA